MILPFRESLQFGQLRAVVQGGDASGEKICVVLAEFGFQKLDEIGEVPRDGHVAGHVKFRVGEEGFELAEEGRVRLRFEQGDEVAEEADARRVLARGGAFRRQFAARIRRASSSLPSMMRVSTKLLRRWMSQADLPWPCLQRVREFRNSELELDAEATGQAVKLAMHFLLALPQLGQEPSVIAHGEPQLGMFVTSVHRETEENLHRSP